MPLVPQRGDMAIDGRNSRTTIKDIARELDVSVSTVSRILRGSSSFNEETVKQVQKKAQELNYRPNILARALVAKGSSLIGLVLRGIGSSFFGDLITGVQVEAEFHGYSVILCNAHMDPETERRHLKNLIDKSVDGLVVTPISAEPTNVDVYNEVMAQGVPLVLVGTPGPGVHAPCVEVDNALGGALAARYLYGIGHRDFVYLTNSNAELRQDSPPFATENAERYRGFRQVLDRHGIANRLSVVEAPHADVSEQTIDALLALKPRPTALFAYSDLMAIRTMRLLERRGVEIPADMSIVGFDDVEMAALVNPSLTTVAQPKREMGVIGAQKLVGLIDGNPTSSVVLQPELIVRESSRELRAASSRINPDVQQEPGPVSARHRVNP